ncbi:MAG: hypothetical protein OER04_01690 [Cyclobacteriaceae bacterium]|nr:hypothetical protein [Cyclobacteriaceae bacterium]
MFLNATGGRFFDNLFRLIDGFVILAMRLLFIFFAGTFLLGGCGDLSEQKANHQKLREGLKRHEIIRATENDIVTMAYQRGDSIVRYLNTVDDLDSALWSSPAGRRYIDSLNQVHEQQVTMSIITRQTRGISELEQQLLEAYEYSFSQSQDLASNVQITDDQVLYTAPVILQGQFHGMWSIWQSKSGIILELGE